MKIKLKIEAFGFPAGTEIEVSDTVGKRFIKDGDASEVVDAPKPKAKSKGTGTISNKAMSA